LSSARPQTSSPPSSEPIPPESTVGLSRSIATVERQQHRDAHDVAISLGIEFAGLPRAPELLRALSRHRSEARFYVSATPAFLNRAAEPLTTDGDVTGAVTRMLADSRAQHAAVEGLGRPSPMADLERARAQLAEIDVRLEGLRSQSAGVRWYQRARRVELDRVANGWLRSRAHWHGEVERLGNEVAAAAPPSRRAPDPLARFDRATRSVRRERDIGCDLGLDR
jgi:hypothetical protein